jgi:hypothetical protein
MFLSFIVGTLVLGSAIVGAIYHIKWLAWIGIGGIGVIMALAIIGETISLFTGGGGPFDDIFGGFFGDDDDF